MKLLKKLNIVLIIGIVSIWNNLLSGKDFRTALVLSGGGARGFAHIGVIKALEEAGFYPDVVIGTSMGAMVGVFYCCGMSADEIERYMKSINWYGVLTGPKLRDIKLVAQKMFELPGLFNVRFDDKFNLVFPRNILSIQGIQNIVFQKIAYWEFVSGGDFDRLFIPFRAVATDIKTGRTIVLDKGSLSRAVAASSAFPLIFAPVKIDSFLLVDGGLTNNVPCDVARSLGADFIVAVDITSKIERLSEERLDLFKYMGQTINTLSYYADTKNLLLADVLIRPELKDISSTDFDSIDVLIRKGYLETKKYIPAIKKWAKKRKLSRDARGNGLNGITITKVVVKNNRGTKDFVVKTEFGVKEGSNFNLEKIREGYKNLLSTGLFNSIWISIERIDKKHARLVLDVEENKKILFSVGANYYSERDSKAFLKGVYNNILGIGFYSELYSIMSNYYSEIGFNVINPGIFTSNIIQSLRLYYQSEKLPLYRSGEYSGYGKYLKAVAEFSSGMQVKRVGLTSVGIRYLHYNILREGAAFSRRAFNARTVFFKIFVDSRDDIDLPRKGRKNNLEFEYRFAKNGGKFYHLNMESRVYESRSENTTYYTYLRVGVASGDASLFDKLRLGGMNDLPGFKEDELLGRVVFCLGIGFTRRLKANIFYNAYFAYGDMKESVDSFNWLKARKGLLNGLVFKTPIGPIRVEYGWNFGKGKALYVSVGHSF